MQNMRPSTADYSAKRPRRTRLLPAQHEPGEVGRVEFVDATTRLAVVIVGNADPELPLRARDREFQQALMGDHVDAEVFKRRNEGQTVDQNRVFHECMYIPEPNQESAVITTTD